MGRGLRGLIGALAAGLVACAPEPCEERRVEGPDGTRLEVCVELATTAEERMAGLVGRALGPGEGLWMVFPVEGEVCLTNEGVDLALDALWVDAAGTVTALERALPAGAPGPWCHGPATYVLEVRAGEAATVEVGDAVLPIAR